MDIGAQAAPAKTSFDGIYDESDPRSYYGRLGAFDYSVPHYGQQVFRQVLEALAADRPTVVDVCCSYGVNAALLKHDIELSDLYERYTAESIADLTSEELAAIDREFYASVSLGDGPEVVGLDAAANAVGYAVDVGLLDRGVAQDLEGSEPCAELESACGSADLVTVTGGIGYVTERTFDRLLGCTPALKPWVAALCLRTVPFEPIAECLASYGLVTEQLDGVTFPQRRFTDAAEREYALGELESLGIDPDGREADGMYHVNVFLSRPADAVADRPISEIITHLP